MFATNEVNYYDRRSLSMAGPKFDPDGGCEPPDELAVGIATRVEAKDGSTQTPPLLSQLIQGHLEGTGIKWIMGSEMRQLFRNSLARQHVPFEASIIKRKNSRLSLCLFKWYFWRVFKNKPQK